MRTKKIYITKNGKIYNKKTLRELKTRIVNGKPVICMNYTTYSLEKLMIASFYRHGNYPFGNMFKVIYKDGNTSNCSLDNIEVYDNDGELQKPDYIEEDIQIEEKYKKPEKLEKPKKEKPKKEKKQKFSRELYIIDPFYSTYQTYEFKDKYREYYRYIRKYNYRKEPVRLPNGNYLTLNFGDIYDLL